MARGVVLRLREGPAVVDQTLVHEVAQLGKGLAQDEPPVVRDLHLPQRLDDERIALAAACRAAVESLRLRSAHELPLPGLGPPDDWRIRSCLHTSSTGGSSTTPHSRPSASAPCSFSVLATAARSLSTAVASFRPFMVPAASAPSRRAAFWRVFSSFTSCASIVLSVSVARCRLSSPLPAEGRIFCAIRFVSHPFVLICQHNTTNYLFATVQPFAGPLCSFL